MCAHLSMCSGGARTQLQHISHHGHTPAAFGNFNLTQQLEGRTHRRRIGVVRVAKQPEAAGLQNLAPQLVGLEGGQRLRCLLNRDIQHRTHSCGGQGIVHVVPPGHAETKITAL